MTVEVHPFQAGLGADISGVDIREPLSTADRDRIRKAWLDNLVLRFRGMPMTDEQHMAFTGQFGALEYNPAKLIEKQYGVETQTIGRKNEIPPEISVISNIIEDGQAIGGLGDGEAFWHTDSSFVDVPPAASLLRSLECPPPSAGGVTSFLNCYSAYETLPEAMKTRIGGLTMIHAATHSSGGKAHKGFETVEDVSKVPGARRDPPFSCLGADKWVPAFAGTRVKCFLEEGVPHAPSNTRRADHRLRQTGRHRQLDGPRARRQGHRGRGLRRPPRGGRQRAQ